MSKKYRRTNEKCEKEIVNQENNETSFYTKFINFLNHEKTQTYLTKTSNILDKVTPAFQKPGFISITTAIVGLASVLNEGKENYADSYFEYGGFWEELKFNALYPFLIEALRQEKFEIIKPYDDARNLIKITTVNGTKIGWIVKYNEVYGSIYYEYGKFDVVRDILKQFLQNKFGDKSIVLRQRISHKTNNNDTISLEVCEDNLVDALKSEKATELATKFQKAFAVNESRSLLLYGPPGSGKSTMARQIAKELNMRSFRVRVEDLGTDSTILFNTIDIFQPDVIILDDFDRSHHVEMLLEVIAYIRRHVKLLIATANKREAIDDAIQRPERIDEVVFIKNIDENVIKNILGDKYTDELFESVKDWPVVYIVEMLRRMKWLTPEEAKNDLLSLAERVERLRKYDNEDTEEDILKLLNQRLLKKENDDYPSPTKSITKKLRTPVN